MRGVGQVLRNDRGEACGGLQDERASGTAAVQDSPGEAQRGIQDRSRGGHGAERPVGGRGGLVADDLIDMPVDQKETEALLNLMDRVLDGLFIAPAEPAAQQQRLLGPRHRQCRHADGPRPYPLGNGLTGRTSRDRPDWLGGAGRSAAR